MQCNLLQHQKFYAQTRRGRFEFLEARELVTASNRPKIPNYPLRKNVGV